MVACSCGNKFLVLLAHMSEDADMIAEPCVPATAYCPGCSAVWRMTAGKWTKVVSQTSLQALRHLSAAEVV